MNRFTRIIAISFSVLLVAYAGFGYLGVPRILAAELPAAIDEQIGRKASVGDISFDPFTFELEVDELRVLDRRDGDFAGFRRFAVDFDPITSLFTLELHFKEVLLEDPLIDIETLDDGELDITDLVGGDEGDDGDEAVDEPSDEPATPSDDASEGAEALPALFFERIAIRGGHVTYTDRSRTPPFERDMGPIEIEVTDFGTRLGQESPYAFKATTARGARIDWSGRITLDPLDSSGEIKISEIPIPWFWEFVEDRAHFVVTDGQLEIAARYDATRTGDAVDFGIEDGFAYVSNLEITPRDDEAPIISVPTFAISGVSVDVGEQRVEIGKLESSGARLAGGLDPEGDFSWGAVLAVDPVEDGGPGEGDDAGPADAEGEGEPGDPWTLSLAELALDGWGFAFEDRTTEPPVSVALDPVSLAVRNVSLDLAQALPVELEAGVGESGVVRVKGSVTPDPLALDLELGIEALDLSAFSPYLTDLGSFQLRRATAGTTGHLRLEAADPSTIVRYAGDFSVANLAAADPAKGRDFLRFDELAITGLDFISEPLAVTIAAVALRAPFFSVLIDERGEVNLTRVFGGGAEEAAKTVAEKEQEAAEASAPIRVDRVEIERARFEFADRSLEPSYETALDISGAISGLSSDPRARAKVDLYGKLNDHAPVAVTGEINPLAVEAYTDLDISLSNIELSSFTPYSGRYVGYELAKGKFTMDLSYNLASRHVEGENRFFLDQLEFGGPVESEAATNLPVPLAVALLKDSKGEISIDLPVRGDLDDPEFSYGGVLLRALVNLITRAATSPFGMLGKLAGFNADELDFVAFPPGAPTLEASERQKLAAIATALAERPSLRLEIHGTAAAADVDGVKVAELERALARRHWDDMSRSAQSAMSGPDDVVLSPDEREDELESLYEESIGESRRTLRNRLRDEREAVAPQPEDEDALVVRAMESALTRAQPAGDRELRALAKARATAIMNELVLVNEVANERVFVVEVELTDQQDGAEVHCPLTLTAS